MRQVERALSAVVLAWWMAVAALAQGPAELLENAVYTEEAVGDVDAALTMYRQIVEDADATRPHIAEAQYRLGMALIKTGKEDEGYAALDTLVRQFPEEGELVRKAQDALIARIRDAVPRNDPAAWFYIDSKEVNGGQPACLSWFFRNAGILATVPEQDTVLISYLPERPLGALPQISVALNDKNRILLRFDLPERTDPLDRLELALPVKLPPALALQEAIEIAVHAVESPWEESTVAWVSQPDIAPQPVATAAVSPEAGSATVDITPLARQWLTGARPNHGLAIKVAVPFFGPSPLDASAPDGKYTAEEIRQMDLDTLFTRMVHPEIGRMHYAGLWALVAKTQESAPEVRETIANRALDCVKDRARWTYERWLCAYLLAGMREERTVPLLAALLKEDPNVPVREGAAGALAELGTPEARAALEEAIKTETVERVRVVIRQALKHELPKHEGVDYLAKGPAQTP